MSFIAGAGATNVDLLYEDMPKIPDVGEEIYTDKLKLLLWKFLCRRSSKGLISSEEKISSF